MASKAEQVVDHFTQDPELKAKILDMIEEIKANPGQHNFDTVIARFTDDPELAATIKANFSKIKAGEATQSIAEKHFGETATADEASDTMARHWGAVEHILAS